MSVVSHPDIPDTGHEYDGIREYDNPTPGWWWTIFGFTVAFSVAYLIFWHASVYSWTIEEGWASDQRAEFARVFGSVGQLQHDEQTIVAQMHNPKFMAIARSVFVGNCAACHASDGGGGVGVNLCDDNYKNVTKIDDIFKVISEGANNGAMPSWKNRLSENERVIVAAYVASLRGTTPASAKAKEGNAIAPWPVTP
jgi:cytochrome c oxidase cbb3-type subunit 3